MAKEKEIVEKAKKKTNKIGGWAFIIGVVLALIAGVLGFTSESLVVIGLIILGLVIGLLNITAKEAMPFLLITTALVIVSSLGGSVLGAIPMLQRTLSTITVLIIPAVLVVAVRAVFALARS